MQLTHLSKFHTFTRTIGFLFIAIGTVVNIAVPIQTFNATQHPSLNISNDEFSPSSDNSNPTSIYPRINAPPGYTDLPLQTQPIEAYVTIHSISPLPAETQETLQTAIEELLKPMIPDIAEYHQRGFKIFKPNLNIEDFQKVNKIPVTNVQYQPLTSPEGMYAFDLVVMSKLDLTHGGKQCNLLDCRHDHHTFARQSSYYGEISQRCVEVGKDKYTGTIWGNHVENGVKLHFPKGVHDFAFQESPDKSQTGWRIFIVVFMMYPDVLI
ncbi:hypothetical protein C8J55DRAFT_586956 [Lentinula edodes]|uniref:Uncharacterized protein n=1 Tax=Lentinula lateritia TaxID=40482 RepID=A0A9W8ZVX1_9AGAR|nr:hypothetical protein C8J55DRAFT_586956 [Lentinula edodes]